MSGNPPISRNTATGTNNTEPQQQRSPPRQRRRLFTIGAFRYQFPQDRRRLVDSCLEAAGWLVEVVVYWLGPLLIALASSIICLMLYAFLTILLPMIVRKHAAVSHPAFAALVIGSHCALVVYLLVQIIFNYYCCVVQKHSGPLYDRIVRELAQAMEFPYPETPEALAMHRRNVSDLLKVRIQRQREEGIRAWMLQGPFEWGYCPHTNQAKPPRSHYDHVVKTLVLNLDHYCPWMFNAVGYLNYRYFVSFLIFVFLAMVYGSILLCEPFLLLKSRDFHQQWLMERKAMKEGVQVLRVSPMMPLRSEKLLVTLVFMLCIALGFAILILGGFHIYLCLTSQTTIEFHGSWSHGSKRNKAKKRNPYSVGRALGNWERVFGRRWLRSLLIPHAREPEFLPVPIPGHSGLRLKFSNEQLGLKVQELESLINVV